MNRVRDGHCDQCVQVAGAVTRHIDRYQISPGYQLVPCSTDPVVMRAKLRAHVEAMAPLGFNAHALGVLAARSLHLLLGSPHDLAARYVMLRKAFAPWGDELADSVERTKISITCLPAVATGIGDGNALSIEATQHSAPSGPASISCLHKAILSGPVELMRFSADGLDVQMRRLVAAGLCASDADARRQCMSHFTLMISRTLEWYLERKAAVLEAGGTLGDVHAACSQRGSMQRSLECVLLWQRSGCAALCLWELLPSGVWLLLDVTFVRVTVQSQQRDVPVQGWVQSVTCIQLIPEQTYGKLWSRRRARRAAVVGRPHAHPGGKGGAARLCRARAGAVPGRGQGAAGAPPAWCVPPCWIFQLYRSES